MKTIKKLILALSVACLSILSYGQMKLSQDSITIYPDLKLRSGLYIAEADTALNDTLGLYMINGWVYTTNLNKVTASWALDHHIPPLIIKMIDGKIHDDFKWPFKSAPNTIIAPRKLDPLEGQQQLMAQIEFLHRYLLRTQIFFVFIISFVFIYAREKRYYD